jgi:hypothetical protein
LTSKLFIFLAVSLFVFSSFLATQAQTGNSIWRGDMNYQSLGQLQAAGWTITHETGVSFSGSAIILDGTQEDTAIHYSNHFPSGISNWKVEDKSRWTLGSHCGNIVSAITDKHSYGFAADGWYGNYAFYRDGQKTTFGSFQESKNAWFTLAMEKQGNQINMYYNGEIKSTYTETDSAASQLMGVDAVSPWRGGSEYDYFEVWQIGDTSTQEAQQSLLSNPIVIGGIIGAVGVGVGGVLYFFVFSGGGTAGSGAGGAGAAGSSGSSGGGGGSGSGGEEQNPMLHPAGGGTLIHPSNNISSTLQSSNPSNLQGTQASTLTDEASNDISGQPTSIPNSTEMQSGETLYDALDKPNSTGAQGNNQSEGSNSPNNSGLHPEAMDTLTQLMNQSQQNSSSQLKPNADIVTQQINNMQDVTNNAASTQMGTRQKMEQASDKSAKTKSDNSTEDST